MSGIDFEFSNAALVLIGHGSTLNADSALPAHQHAEALRERKLFGQVIEAYWKEEPYIWQVLRGVFAPTVFIVPLFISEGYFTEEVIPRELGMCAPGEKTFSRIQKRGDQTLIYCNPVGTHESMTDVLMARAREIVQKFPFPHAPKTKDTSLFIAGHGTGNNENSRVAIERQVELIAAQGIYSDVHAVFMEEAPKIEEIYTLSQQKNVVVVPFFISDGLHSYEDIPVMLGEPAAVVQQRFTAGQPTWRNPTEKKGKRVWYTPSIGTEALMVEVILARASEARTMMAASV